MFGAALLEDVFAQGVGIEVFLAQEGVDGGLAVAVEDGAGAFGRGDAKLVAPTPTTNDRDLLEAGAGLDVDAGLVADADAFACAVVHAPGEIGIDLLSVIGFGGGEPRTGGGLGALQAVFANFLGDVHVGFR